MYNGVKPFCEDDNNDDDDSGDDDDVVVVSLPHWKYYNEMDFRLAGLIQALCKHSCVSKGGIEPTGSEFD